MPNNKDDRQAIRITMPYIPGLSVNHYKAGRSKHTKPEVKEWMAALTKEVTLAPIWRHLGTRIKVTISAEFKDKRVVCDTHNFEKIILDAVALGLGIDDEYLATETVPPTINKRDYGIFFSKSVNLQATGEITIELRELK